MVEKGRLCQTSGGPSQITLCILAYTGCELKMDSFGDREPGNNFHQLAPQSANEGTVYLWTNIDQFRK